MNKKNDNLSAIEDKKRFIKEIEIALKDKSFSKKELYSNFSLLTEEYKLLLEQLSTSSQPEKETSPAVKKTKEKRKPKLIFKQKVSNGLYWVEIPDLGLKLQCGCPADSVKNLKKRGIIMWKEKDGVLYETGPNAILLSDVAIQNGSFANLAEFSILQILYRQGAIIPGHPNNSGEKPVIMGVEEMVKAQCEYFYRGNYGLATMEELMEGGLTWKEAEVQFRMKMRFAFDNIRNTEELVDMRIIKDDLLILKDEVFIHRRALNVYEIIWKEDSVIVDLNLKSNENFEASYSLGIHEISREYFSVIHSGEGDGWDVDRPCMGSIVTYQGKIFLVDAGPHILETLNSFGISVNEIEGIFHTHAHDDHFAGLTSLLRSDHRIKYYATSLVRESVTKKISALMNIEEDQFAYYFDIQDLKVGVWNNLDGLEVKPVFSPHPIETTILFFRTQWGGGYKSYAHFADIISFQVLKQMITKDGEKSGISEKLYDKVIRDYLMPADIKKLDVGGGLIHGRAEDFLKDKSGKIILSHTEYELTNSQKEIGSSAYFGMQDVLINSEQDYAMVAAHRYLSTYFPDVPHYELRMLLNYSLISFNPGSIVVKRGSIPKNVYLVVSGVLEYIQSEDDINYQLSAGAIMGEYSGLTQSPFEGTFRAVSYVRILSLPCDLYFAFMKRHGLFEKIEALCINRNLLKKTWLFGEIVSYPIINDIARELVTQEFEDCDIGTKLEEPSLIILGEGTITLYSENKVIGKLEAGDICGEDRFFLETTGFFKMIAEGHVQVYVIPFSKVENIPIVRWKLFELFKKRIIKFTTVFTFQWNEEYCLGIDVLDKEHEKLFALGHTIYTLYENKEGGKKFRKQFGILLEAMENHFATEEGLMKKFGYNDYEAHKREHGKIWQELIGFEKRLCDDDKCEETEKEFLDFLRNWLVKHSLIDDRKYKPFFVSKGL